jgi:hypothetical protein
MKDLHGYFVGSLLFLFGCFAFVADSILAKNKVYFVGSLLFTIGTLFYLLDSIRLMIES